MSRVLISLQAQDCNAWSSEGVYGLPSPLSAALYLRALFAEHAGLGFGQPQAFALALRGVGTDPGVLSSRPLLTYMDKNTEDKAGPLFDEHRYSLDLHLVVQTSGSPALFGADETARLADLARAIRFQRFLGGHVVQAQVRAVTDTPGLVRALRGSRLYVDETERLIRPGRSSLNVLRACLLANLRSSQGDQGEAPTVQDKASEKWGIPPDLWADVNGRWLRVLPLAYRRLSPFMARPDARFVLDAQRNPQSSVHAFVESVYGVVDLIGPAQAFDPDALRNLWWSATPPSSLHDPLVFSVKGSPHHE